MEVLHLNYSGDWLKRVAFYANADGSIGYCEERYSDEPLEQCWLPGLWPDSRSVNLETAIAEATGRVAWLAKNRH